jgi:hypothetical protein
MYGMVNKAVEDMVCTQFGESVWEEIKSCAGVDIDVFMSNEAYPDDMTFQLVSAASEVLKIPAEAVLEAFGQHWVLHTAQKGYGGLMQANGSSLPEFLANLPGFHSRVQMLFPKLQPPGFECTDVMENSLKLHYRTHRAGLVHFVIGLMQGLGKLFNTPVTVHLVESKEQGADHDVFDVKWSNDAIE